MEVGETPLLPLHRFKPRQLLTPSFGTDAGDLLTNEVNLTYQYDNVRMLLNRSLSDRLYNGAITPANRSRIRRRPETSVKCR